MKIDKNILIPYGYRCGHQFPFEKMKIGDSFLATKSINVASLRSSATKFGKKNDMKFLTRTVEDGTRIWRIK